MLLARMLSSNPQPILCLEIYPVEPLLAPETRLLVRVSPRGTPIQLTRPLVQVPSAPVLPPKTHRHSALLVPPSLLQGSEHLEVVAALLVPAPLDNPVQVRQAPLAPICSGNLRPTPARSALAEASSGLSLRPLLAQQPVSALLSQPFQLLTEVCCSWHATHTSCDHNGNVQSPLSISYRQGCDFKCHLAISSDYMYARLQRIFL